MIWFRNMMTCLALGWLMPAPMGLAAKETNALKDVTILIIRHAEKPEKGHSLSREGERRAQAYVSYFKGFKLDGRPLKLDAIYATEDSKNSERPRLTVLPLARALGLKIHSSFKDEEVAKLVGALHEKHQGRQILISWHHGMIPELLRELGEDPADLLPKGKWPGEVFDWVLQLRFDHKGKLIANETKCIHEKLMPGDS